MIQNHKKILKKCTDDKNVSHDCLEIAINPSPKGLINQLFLTNLHIFSPAAENVESLI